MKILQDKQLINFLLIPLLMLPEKSLIKKEMLFRVLYPDSSIKLSKQSTIRFILLSLGLIYPNETRTSIIEVFEIILDKHLKGEGFTAFEIIEKLKGKVDEKTVYYHLKRLSDINLISKKEGEYFLGDGFEKDLVRIIEKIYKNHLDEMLSSIKEAYLSLKQR